MIDWSKVRHDDPRYPYRGIQPYDVPDEATSAAGPWIDEAARIPTSAFLAMARDPAIAAWITFYTPTGMREEPITEQEFYAIEGDKNPSNK